LEGETMGKVMISLVSDQRMQNIIPVFQEDMGNDDLLIPVISCLRGDLNPRYKRAYECTVEALAGHVVAQEPEPRNAVEPFIIADTETLCRRLIQEHANQDQEVIINITGGMKPMSIGAYCAAISEGVRTVYVDTENEQIVTFYPDGRHSLASFNERVAEIGVRTYLVAHGKHIDDTQTEKQAFKITELETARLLMTFELERVARFMDRLASAVGSVSRNFKDRRYFEVSLDDIESDDELPEILVNNGYATRLDGDLIRIQKGEKWNFLSGRWLEAYVYLALKDSGQFHDVCSGVQLQGVQNDLDVICVHNAKLAICECKAGDPGGQKTLNKLRTLKETVGGTFGRSFFVTTMKRVALGSRFCDRAREYDITEIVDIDRLPDIAAIILAKMKGK
jgi:hypothetical protein